MIGQLIQGFISSWWNIVALVLLAIITHYIWDRLTHKYPPGPLPLPLFGNGIKLMLLKEWSFEYFLELSKKYGPIMSLKMHQFSKPVVIFSDIESIKKTIVKKQDDYANRMTTYSGDLFSDGGRDIVFGQFGPAWTYHRKLAHQAFRQFASKEALADSVIESVKEISESIKDLKEAPFDPYQYVYLLVYNVICAMTFGKHYKMDDKEFLEIFGTLDKLNQEFVSGFFLADILPAFQYIPTPQLKLVKNLMSKLMQKFQSMVDERKKTFDSDVCNDILDNMILAQKKAQETGEKEAELITDSHLRLTMIDVFSGGTDTTAFTTLWTILMTVSHPEVQDKIHKEIDHVTGATRSLRAGDKENLPYTEAVILETMRFRPLTPIGGGRATTCDTTIDNYELMKNTPVFWNTWALHFSEKYWKNPYEFNPARFIDPQTGKLAPFNSSFLPFGTGRRVCLGESIAKIQSFYVFAGLMQRFKFSFPPDEADPDTNMAGSAFFAIPKRYKLIAKLRE